MRASKLLLTLSLSATSLALPAEENSAKYPTFTIESDGHRYTITSGLHFAPTTVTSILTDNTVPGHPHSVIYNTRRDEDAASSSPGLSTSSKVTHTGFAGIWSGPAQSSSMTNRDQDDGAKKKPKHDKKDDSDDDPMFVPIEQTDATPQHPPRQEPCSPLDPSCWQPPKRSDPCGPMCSGHNKRDIPWLSGAAGHFFFKWGTQTCFRNAGVPWVDCMNDFRNSVDDYFKAKHDDKASPSMEFSHYGEELYLWAQQECSSLVGSSDWDDCMERFRNEVDDLFKAEFDPYTQHEKRDEPNDAMYQSIGEQLYAMGERRCQSTSGDDLVACLDDFRNHVDDYVKGKIEEDSDQLDDETDKRDVSPQDQARLEELMGRVDDYCKAMMGNGWQQCRNRVLDNAMTISEQLNSYVKRDRSSDINQQLDELLHQGAPECNGLSTTGNLTSDGWQKCWKQMRHQFWKMMSSTSGSQEKRNAWTQWACTRGVQRACQYPDLGVRDDHEDHASSTDDHFATMVKRDPDLPTEISQTITHHSSADGQTYTALLVLETTSPNVYRDTFLASGTSYNVIISQMASEPTSAAQTLIWGSNTHVHWTSTSDPESIGLLTSVDLGAYETPAEHRKRGDNRVQTVTILDEQPGHTTLNPGAATQKKHPTTRVTLVDIDGKKHTVSATTDSNGKSILATEGFVVERSKETATMFLLHDKHEVQTIHSTKTGQDVVTATVHVTESTDITMGIPVPEVPSSSPGVEPPVPKVAIPSSHSTIIAPIPKVEIPQVSTVYKTVKETVTKIRVPKFPVPTMYPLDWDLSLYDLSDRQDVMAMPLADLKRLYPNADWESKISQMAQQIRDHDSSISNETSLKYAFLMQNGKLGNKGIYPPLDEDENHVTQFAVTRPEKTITYPASTIPITAPTQIIAGTRYQNGDLGKYRDYDPVRHPVKPTGSCHKHDDDSDKDTTNWPKEHHQYNKTECHIEQCMWEFMKPIRITTVETAVFMSSDRPIIDFWTHTTRLYEPHWGTRETTGVYYPMHTTYTTSNDTIRAQPARATPTGMSDDDVTNQKIHRKGPECDTIEECHNLCVRRQHDPSSVWERYWPWIITALVILALLCLLWLLLSCLKRRRRDKSNDRRDSRRPSEKPQQDVVVNQVTGAVTDTSGNPVDPATAENTAVIAGSAAGAEAARGDQGGNQGSGGDGRGTTGRRAEEGRGRVNFEDGGKPGQEGGEQPPGQAQETVTTEKRPGEAGGPQETDHVEPQPVPDKDGAAGVVTGRQGPDVGSMRGRKRNRPEGIAGLGF